MTIYYIDLGNKNNTLTFGDDDYVVTGMDGSNILDFGSGTDQLTLGNGNNTLTLGGGTDNITMGTGNNTVTVQALASIGFRLRQETILSPLVTASL